MTSVSKNSRKSVLEAAKKSPMKALSSVLFALAIFLFWFFAVPHLLSFHEQNQLFLYDWKYLIQRLAVGGGLADLIGEFLVQFFCYQLAGAIIMALLFSGLQLALARIFSNYAFSFVAPLLILVWMGNVDVLVNFPVALLAAVLLCPLFAKCGWWNVVAFPLAFWLLGPVAAVPMLYALICNRSVKELVCLVAGGAICYALYRLFLDQYPARDVFCGINYYRGRYTLPALQIVSLLIVPVLSVVDRLLPSSTRKPVCQVLCICVFVAGALVGMRYTYDKDVHTYLKFDRDIRYGRFEDVLKTARRYQPHNAPSCTAVNLALYMTGRIDKDLDKYFQIGTDGLIMPSIRDNLSMIASSEAFWLMGLPNQALQYSFDLQESIPNCRKSGRYTMRIAQCHIIDGHYDIASRYLDILSKTLVYRAWANKQKKLLWDEEAIAKHPEYSVLRKFRMEEDIIPEKSNFEYVFACLYKKNNENMLAAQYFMAWQKLQPLDSIDANE